MQPTIKRIYTSDGSGNASVATVQATRTAPATTIQVDTVQGFPQEFCGSMGTSHTFTDPVTGEEITIISEATAVDFKGHVDGLNLEIDEIDPGYVDNGSEVGDIVVIRPTSEYGNNIAKILEVSHTDNGSLKSDAPIDSPQASLANITPIGSVLDFAGATAPDGWLLCYGQEISRSDYSDLFAVIGTTYGVGNGSTTFNLPDLRGRVVAGQDDMGGSSANRLTSPVDGDVLGASGGAEGVTLTAAQSGLPSHSHSISRSNTSGSNNFGYIGPTGNFTDNGATTANAGGTPASQAHNNVQPTIILNKIIKY